MNHLTESQRKWRIFCLMAPVHLVITWMGFHFSWYLVEIAAILPLVPIEGLELKILTSCYEIICMPSKMGWCLCLIIWIAFDYVVAIMFSKLSRGRSLKG